jgi:hypothetical protein
MFKRYNDTARWQTKGIYSTTIALTSSAQIKLSKICKACKVFRGICGGQLPDSFYTPSVFNVKGGIERAFMSTTTDLAVAADFAASQGEGKIGVVYEMEMGMIDRGADLSIMSQYPHEKEILFAPLTGLEVQGTVRKGNVLHISTRLNTNLKAQTIEEMQSKMKNSHLSMVDILKEELQELGITGDNLGLLIELRAGAAALSELQFSSAEFYSEVTNKALECKQEVCKSVLLSAGVEQSGELFLKASQQITSSKCFASTLCELSENKAKKFASQANFSEISFRHIAFIPYSEESSDSDSEEEEEDSEMTSEQYEAYQERVKKRVALPCSLSEEPNASIISRLSLALVNSSASISLDLTGGVMTDEIKILTGDALLQSAASICCPIASVRTDHYTLTADVKELDLANRRLQVPGRRVSGWLLTPH